MASFSDAAARSFFADMKFHDVRAEMRARGYKAAGARQLKQTRLALLWRNYRNIPFATLDALDALDALNTMNTMNTTTNTLDTSTTTNTTDTMNTMNTMGTEHTGTRVLLANHLQNAHLLTRKASLCRCLDGAARAAGGAWLRGRFPRTFVVTIPKIKKNIFVQLSTGK